MHNEPIVIKTITKKHNRCFIIGDLHGMYDEAKKLLEICDVNDDDLVIFVGDLIDRGPDNGKCVDLAMKYDSVMGNHESRHIAYERSYRKGDDLTNIHPEHRRTREQLTEQHHEYFKSLPHIIRIPQYNLAVVHAGVFPGVQLVNQQIHHLLHIQMVNPELGTKSMWPSKAPSDWTFWANLWDGNERIVFGHTVFSKPVIEKQAVGVDCGCVFGGDLAAFDASTNNVKTLDRKRSTQGTLRTYSIFSDAVVYS